MVKFVLVAVLAAAGAASVMGLASRSEASASGAGDPRIAVLQKQVKKLQAEVKALQTQSRAVTAVVGDVREQLHLNFEGDTCLGAQVADLFQGTWGVLDQVAQTAQQKTYFGPQTQVNDYENCKDLAQPSVPRLPITVPPKIDPLVPLIQWLHE